MKREKSLTGIFSATIGLFLVVVLLTFFVLYGYAKGNYVDNTLKKYKPIGAAVGIMKSDGMFEYKNYGYADKTNKVKVTKDTKFKIASISKTVTSYAVMQLVDQGVLDLDKPVNEYLVSWKIPDSKQYDVNKVTLRTLMSHTSGLSKSDELGYNEPLPSAAEAMEMREIHLVREPGTEFEYSEFVGHGICQLVIEDVTGMKFEDYMEKEVFKPLGMNHTGYENSGDGVAIPYAGYGREVPVIPIVMNGAGGVTTTAEDLLIFTKELIRYEEQSSGEMFRIQDHTQSAGGYYALGIIPRQLSNGKTVYEHNGTLTGWNAQLVISLEDQASMVVLTNSDKAYYMTYELMDKWGQHIVGAPIKDSLMNGIRTTCNRVCMGLGALVIIYAIYCMVHATGNKLERVHDKRRTVRFIVSAVAIIIYLCLFYTRLPFLWMFGNDNNYLYTYFPPERIWVYLNIILLLAMWIIKGGYRKNVLTK